MIRSKKQIGAETSCLSTRSASRPVHKEECENPYMNKEVKDYLRNTLKKESFYIDVISSILGLTVIILTAVSFYTDRTGLLKAVFVLAFLIMIINAYKGFKLRLPTRYIYAVLSLVMAGMCIYS